MKPKLLFALLLGWLTYGAANAQEQKGTADDICGTYYVESPVSDDAVKIQIYRATNGKYQGRFVWLSQPNNPDGTPHTTVVPGRDGVTEVNIRLLHQLDDAEVRSNFSYLRPNYDAWLEQRKEWTVVFIDRFTQENGRAPYDDELESARDTAFPKNWLLSIEQITGEFGDESACRVLSFRSHSEPASPVIERLHEVVASMPESWQEIYQKHVNDGWSFTKIASQRGVSSSAIRKTMKKIESSIGKDEKLQKFFQRGAFSA